MLAGTAVLVVREGSGRALGVRNLMQAGHAWATSWCVGALVASCCFGWAFAAVAVFPVLGAWLTPVAGERRARYPGDVRLPI